MFPTKQTGVRLSALKRNVFFVACAAALTSQRSESFAANKPTDDAAAFRRINLYSDRALAEHVNDHINLSEYPSFLQDTTSLLVRRSTTDTVALFDSRPHDGIGLAARHFGPNSRLFYTIDPQFATSVGLLTVEGIVMNGSGFWDDFGKSLLRVITRYDDLDSTADSLRVGSRIRNYHSGANGCDTRYPYYIAKPSDPLAGEFWSGTVGDFQYFYDVQELKLPSAKRQKKVYAIEVLADSIIHDPVCGGYEATSGLFGLSVWNDFKIRSASDQPVQLQTQYDLSWADAPYGGYIYNGSLVGSDRTMGALGCLVSCAAMCRNYYGVAATPQTLNQELQLTNGYNPVVVARITQVKGLGGVNDSVLFQVIGDSTNELRPRFLVDHGRGHPVATIATLGSSGSAGVGRIVERFEDAVSVGDMGSVYTLTRGDLAAKGYKFILVGGGSRAPAVAESALASGRPVLLYTKLNPAGDAHHWVVADGREPAFLSATSASGTYGIKDPGFTDHGTPLSRLIQSPHNNKFTQVRICTPVTGGLPAMRAGASGVAESGGALDLILLGPATMNVTDPLAQEITYDASVGEYVSDIPDALPSHRFVVADTTDSSIGADPLEMFELPSVLDGNYYITVNGVGNGAFVLQATAPEGSGAASVARVMGSCTVGSSSSYRVAYTKSTASVMVDVVSVPSSGSSSDGWLYAFPNPSANQVRVEFGLKHDGPVRLGVFDLQGRCVKALLLEDMIAGPHSIDWDGKDANARRIGAGIYFIRLATDGNVRVRRIAVTR